MNILKKIFTKPKPKPRSKSSIHKLGYKPFKLEKLNIVIGCKITNAGLKVITNTNKYTKHQIKCAIEQEIMPYLNEIFIKIEKG